MGAGHATVLLVLLLTLGIPLSGHPTAVAHAPVRHASSCIDCPIANITIGNATALEIGPPVWDPASNEVYFFNGSFAYPYDSNITVVSASNYTFVRNIALPFGGENILLDPRNHDLYVLGGWDLGTMIVTVINGTTNHIVKLIRMPGSPGGSFDWYGVFDDRNGYVYVGSVYYNSVNILNGTSVLTTLYFSSATYAAGIAYDAANGEVYLNTVYFLNYSQGPLVEVNGTAIVGVLNLPNLSVGDLAYDPVNANLYLIGQNPSTSAAWVDIVHNASVSGAWLPELPAGIAVNLRTGAVYLPYATSLTTPGGVLVLNGSAVTGNISVGPEPASPIYDPVDGLVYVPFTGGMAVLRATGVAASIGLSGSPFQFLSQSPSEDIAIQTNNDQLYVLLQNSTGMQYFTVVQGGAISYPPIAISSFTATPPIVSENLTSTLSLTATGGGGALSYTYTGLPTGCSSIDSATNPCTPSQQGWFTVRVYVNDSFGDTATATLTLKVTSALSVSLTATGPFQEGSPFTLSAAVSSGDGTYLYGYTGLPPGCTSQNLSLLSCTPTVAGSFEITVQVTDTLGDTGEASADVTVTSSGGGSPLTIDQFVAHPAQILIGATTSIYLNATGGAGAYEYVYTGLPSGCASVDLPEVSCLPQTTGMFTIRGYVNDTVASATATTTLSVTSSGTSNAALTAVQISPPWPSVETGQTVDLEALAACGASVCPEGVTYFWSAPGDLGMLNTSSGTEVGFEANETAGQTTVTVEAMLNGRTDVAHVELNITQPTSPSPSTSQSPGSATVELAVLGLVIAVVVAVVVAALLFLRRKKRAADPDSPIERPTP